MTATQPMPGHPATSSRRLSWWATAAVVAVNIAVSFTLAQAWWLLALLLGAGLAVAVPQRHLPLVKVFVRGALLTVPVFFALLVTLPPLSFSAGE